MFERFSAKLNLSSNTFLDGFALVAGGCLTLAFAPYSYFLFALFSLAVLLVSWVKISPRRAFWRGWLFGLGFFSTSVSWVYHSVHVYGHAPAILAFLTAALLIAYCALYPALVGFLLNRFFYVDGIVRYAIGFPGIWIFCEWLRSILFSGFPWMQIGVSQVNSPLRGLSPIIGAYGISFILASTAGALLYAAIATNRVRRILFGSLIFVWVSAFALSYCQWAYPLEQHLSISLIQGNIEQNVKWDQAQLVKTLDLYKNMTESQLGKDLIILPEAAIPTPSWEIQPYLDELDTQAKKAKSIIIAGIPMQDRLTGEYTNSLIVLGETTGKYSKRHLVPFGEYFPMSDFFKGFFDFMQIPMSDYKGGLLDQPPLYVKGTVVSPLICYEVAYGGLVHFSLPEAQVLLVLSDDSWFGDSNAPAQHLQIMQMRAQETQRPVISATNNGVTAIINPFGDIVEQAPRFQQTILTGSVDGMHGMTPLMWYGENMVLLTLFALTLIGLVLQNIKESGE